MRKPINERMETLRKHQVDQQERPEFIKDETLGTDVLKIDDVKTAVGVFQPRTLDGQLEVSEEHIAALKKVLTLGKPLDPIHVWWSGKVWYVVDGHHRLQAYLRWRDKTSKRKHEVIPVVLFEGTLEEGMLFAAEMNSKNKLPMTQEDKSTSAWRFVCLTDLSKRAIADACVVGAATVSRMRKALRVVLGMLSSETRETLSVFHWWQIRQLLTPDQKEFDPDDKLREEIEKIAERLRKDHGGNLMKNPEAFAGAIARYNSRLPQILAESYQWAELFDRQREAREADAEEEDSEVTPEDLGKPSWSGERLEKPREDRWDSPDEY